MDVWIALIFGVIGFFARRHGFAVAPIAVGLILGEMVETSGHGGKFPSGITVGKVISFSSGHYLIKLSANPQRLRFASIIDVNDRSIKNDKSIGLAPLQDKKNIFDLRGFNKIN